MLAHGAVAVAVLAAAASAAPANDTTVATPTAGGNACATISQYLEATTTLLPATLGLDCLQSVPVDTDGDLQLVKEIRNIMQWKSTLAYLKDPPQGYARPSVDLLGGLDDIANKLSKGGYTNEYAVQIDISNLLKKAYDGHTAYISDMSSVFAFGKVDEHNIPVELVSLSSDGKSLPKVYVFNDIAKARTQSNFTPSAVTTVNNQSVVDYLNWLAIGNSQSPDLDVGYQTIFWDPAKRSFSGSGGGFFQNSLSYEGSSSVFGFENGTEATIRHIAFPTANFSGVDSGEAFFSKFCTGPTPTPTSESPAESTSAEPIPTAFGYPYPVAKAEDNSVSGYFLNGTGYQDVAVISSASFLAANMSDFQNVVSEVIAEATAQKKKYLIVDLRRNGGGSILLGYDLFKQLFPSIEPYGATRVRAADSYNAMGQVVTAIADEYDIANNETAQEEIFDSFQYGIIRHFWAQSVGLDVNNKEFPSWEAFFGPEAIHGDNFTNLVRNNFSDPLQVGDFSVSGYGDNSDVPSQPFKAENIVLLQDGTCASTCAVFAELMKTQAGVKSIVMGGRPQNGPMVGVGGTKGAEVLTWGQIIYAANYTRNLAETFDSDSLDLLEASGVTDLADAEQVLSRTAVVAGDRKGALNYRNNYRKGDDSNTPLQFVPEYADCRIFYTAPMLFDPVSVWTTVFDTMWRNGSCVPGSTGHVTSAINGTNSGPGQFTSGSSSSRGMAQSGLAMLVGFATIMMLM
ncbi:Peptidase S41 family protein ustP [Lasiodiplodia hormozganensis]|uniref:Peptidase S41 family protein ustP n=1 Tax=Lasiodiplodia hormozganensis TaxID=869390 RepID=A0AA40CYE8_9PEZI|nr:Peptidase S41 family protein ustP [Lasiodiplodia hormozganensis]